MVLLFAAFDRWYTFFLIWWMQIECEVVGEPFFTDSKTVGFRGRDSSNREFECHTPSYTNARDVLDWVKRWKGKTVRLEGCFVGETFRILKLIEEK